MILGPKVPILGVIGLLSSFGVFGAGYGIGTKVFKVKKEDEIVKPTRSSSGKILKDGNKLSIGTISALNTSELHWQFLYYLSRKIFDYLKKKGKVGEETDLINWFKDKLGKEYKSEITEDWKKFRSLCFKALEDEDSAKWSEVMAGESRLCFMGSKNSNKLNGKTNFIKANLESAIHKGRIGKLRTKSDYSGLDVFDSNKWSESISNIDLYDDFWNNLNSSLKNEYYNSSDISPYSFSKFWNSWLGEDKETTHSGQYGKKIKSWLE